jgi:hypothetical protein
MARTPLTRPWTEKEIAELERRLESGATPLTAALKLRRRVLGVRSKIRNLKRPEAASEAPLRRPTRPCQTS